MADRERFLRGGRNLLLATGMLALALGLGAAGAGVIDAAPTPDPKRSAGAHAPPGLALEAEGWRPTVPEVRPGAGSREDTAVLAIGGEDGREYLARMAALMRLRRAATYVGPYQASLNPAVYLAGETAPGEMIVGDGTRKFARPQHPHGRAPRRQRPCPAGRRQSPRCGSRRRPAGPDPTLVLPENRVRNWVRRTEARAAAGTRLGTSYGCACRAGHASSKYVQIAGAAPARAGSRHASQTKEDG